MVKSNRNQRVEELCAPSLHHAHDAFARLVGAPAATTHREEALAVQLQGTSLGDAQLRGLNAQSHATQVDWPQLESNNGDEAEWVEPPWRGHHSISENVFPDEVRSSHGKPRVSKKLNSALRIQERAIAKGRRKAAAPHAARTSTARELQRQQEALLLRRLGLPVSAETAATRERRAARNVDVLDQQLGLVSISTPP